MIKAKKPTTKDRNAIQRRNLFYVAVGILMLKLLIIFSIRFGGWPGSDAEGYVPGAASLLQDGFFSKNSILSYLPAGYPITIWLVSLMTFSGASIIHGTSFAVISIFQTLVYFGASVYFVEVIRKTGIKKVALPTVLILGLNPTLSLSSMVAGYESLVASCIIFSVALLIDYHLNQKSRNLIRTVILVGILQSIAGFMQPRILLIGFILFIVFGFYQNSIKTFALILVVSSIAMATCSIVLVFRNNKANGQSVVSSQFAGTLMGGYGDGATGGFSGGIPYLKCSSSGSATVVTTLPAIKCVANWNLHHPGHAIRLLINKSVYFWSPWSGPLANGTMARNPWLKVDPIQNIVSTKSGRAFVLGFWGQLVSWIWLLGGILLLFGGLQHLWMLGVLERRISLFLFIPILVEWLISLGTYGDHRYRIPIMGLSLVLQVVGFQALKERLFRPTHPSTLAVKPRTR